MKQEDNYFFPYENKCACHIGNLNCVNKFVVHPGCWLVTLPECTCIPLGDNMQMKKGGLLAISIMLLLTLSVSAVSAENNSILFIQGTDVNNASLNNAALDANISSELNITIFSKDDAVPVGINFSNYSMIFIESVNESDANGWEANISSAIDNGTMVIDYNLSSNITPNVDLYSNEYTNIERYWVQGGDTNMESMLRFMGQEFCGAFVNDSIPEPVLLQQVTNITYILNSDASIYYFNEVLPEREILTDLFDVTVMDGEDAASNLSDVSNQDVIILYMIGGTEMAEFKDQILAAKDSGTQIGLFGMDDSYNVTTFDMKSPPHNAMQDYLKNSSSTNMEYWVRYVGAVLEDVYIEYAPAAPPSIPSDGIYHPDAYPRVFENSTEYLEWYADHGYNASAPTVGIMIQQIEQTSTLLKTEDRMIRNLESNGCNVILTTYKACTQDTDYFTNNGTVLVDSMISLRGFNFVWNNPDVGVTYLEGYNVPTIKALVDNNYSPDDYNNSSHGLSPNGVSYQVSMPELEGLLDFIWLKGSVGNPETDTPYIDCQVDWICERAIGWAELGKTPNSDKKVTIIYYNHEGGKNNIGASYLDVGSSFTLLLEEMQSEGYDVGNGTIPNGSEFIDLFIESRNVGTWAPEELEKVVNSGNVTLLSVDDYLAWYNTLPADVREDVEATWGEAPGDVMVYDGQFVIPTIQLGNINFVPQPTRGGLSDESLIYHDKELPPTHQYLATYFWINKVYDADAMVHFGTHGTQEWLPGKEVGLWRYDYPSIMVAETPVIYPYIMDNVGEGTQAKRRGNAVIIDHLTPPIVEAGIYGDLLTVHDKIHNYEDAKATNDTVGMQLYRSSIIEYYDTLNLVYDLGVTIDELESMTDEEFESFLDSTLHDYLHELQTTLMPYGLHTFGVAPQDEKLVSMVKSMLGNDFVDHIYNVIPKDTGDEEDWEDSANEYATELLNETLLNGTAVVSAQDNVLGLNDSNVTSDLNDALDYSALLGQTTREISQALKALDAGYIEPGPGNDPIRNIDALPTGRNFYSFEPDKIPDTETVILGDMLATQMLDQYKDTHNGSYPNKVSYVLWATESMRHRGLMEAQIYGLLGVEPVYKYGRVVDFTVITTENMTHPRIDVMIVASGLYRDTFTKQMQLMDKAVRTVAARNESNETNYVRWNSLRIEDELLAIGYNNTTATYLSQSRVFSESPGAYGTGMTSAVTASETWEDEDKVADLFMSRMSNIYGEDVWGESYEDVLRANLKDVDVALHSDSTNLYGMIDNDDYYQYLGGIALAVRSLTGETPELFIADLKNVNNLGVTSANEAFRKELRSRYYNPSWISGMMEYDYAGAREFMKFTEHMWGWDVMTPDMVTDSDWNEIYEVYFEDKYDLGVDEFMQSENPYAYQSMAARMLEAARKGYWDAPEEVLQDLAERLEESVAAEGVACCHHTCGNPLLADYTSGLLSTPTIVRHSSDDVVQAKIVNSSSSNQTSSSEGGYAESNVEPVPEAGDYVEGYEMTKESQQAEESGGMSFSGADVVGSVLVLAAMGVIYLGYRRRGI